MMYYVYLDHCDFDWEMGPFTGPWETLEKALNVLHRSMCVTSSMWYKGHCSCQISGAALYCSAINSEMYMGWEVITNFEF
jgi:hypothetical protein